MTARHSRYNINQISGKGAIYFELPQDIATRAVTVDTTHDITIYKDATTHDIFHIDIVASRQLPTATVLKKLIKDIDIDPDTEGVLDLAVSLLKP